MAQAATARLGTEQASLLSREAVQYSVKELARRAGVHAKLFRTWRVVMEKDFVNVVVDSTGSRIRFPYAHADFRQQIQAGQIHTATASWMGPSPKTYALTADFKIPFSSSASMDLGPLFRVTAASTIDCAVDLLSSLFLTLSRFEETLPVRRDRHGRFSAVSSVAWRDGFLHRPIVDEYGLAFSEALHRLLPGWEPGRPRFRVKLGHDVDEIGYPFSLRGIVGHTIRRGQPGASLRDCAAPWFGIDTNYQLLLRKVVALALRRGLKPAVYWKASAAGPHDTGYDPRHSSLRAMIARFQSYGLEMGIHPGYESFQSPEKLSAEVAILRSVLGEIRLGGRQDFLRWTPGCWEHWEACGLAYDASVGYADHVGFRAGTCHPYHPWLASQGRQAELLEIPLLAMDCTLQSYMKADADEALQHLRDCARRCRQVGGVFTLVWHHTRLPHAGYARAYRAFLDEISDCEAYDGRFAEHETY
jgi:hypothetical protein